MCVKFFSFWAYNKNLILVKGERDQMCKNIKNSNEKYCEYA